MRPSCQFNTSCGGEWCQFWLLGFDSWSLRWWANRSSKHRSLTLHVCFYPSRKQIQYGQIEQRGLINVSGHTISWVSFWCDQCVFVCFYASNAWTTWGADSKRSSLPAWHWLSCALCTVHVVLEVSCCKATVQSVSLTLTIAEVWQGNQLRHDSVLA